ncbi:MAG: hypothetical protein N2444_00530 [Methylocystis sp.]|nr:hypothetical protein [Methylocystis sp.]
MTVTIQGTSKKLKAAVLIANIIQLIGILGFVGAIGSDGAIDPMPSLYVIGVGIVAHIVAKALIWWNHA